MLIADITRCYADSCKIKRTSKPNFVVDVGWLKKLEKSVDKDYQSLDYLLLAVMLDDKCATDWEIVHDN